VSWQHRRFIPNGKPKKTRKKSAKAQAKKLSALDAAAQVLAETGQPLSCKEMIEAMAQKGYWSSPGGKTPPLPTLLFRDPEGDLHQGEGIPLSEDRPRPLRADLASSPRGLPLFWDNASRRQPLLMNCSARR